MTIAPCPRPPFPHREPHRHRRGRPRCRHPRRRPRGRTPRGTRRPPRHPHYAVRLARNEDEVRAAQRLRHQVFADELGARLDGPEPGLDSDAFDAYCDHLLVVEEETEQVVGTYRLLPPSAPPSPAGSTPRASSTSPPSPRSAPTSSRSAAPASTPTIATAPSSP